jgi:ubiquinone/menaquinone biosynthesis C-methylase UbiE
MESLYYADSIEIALEKIYKLLKPGGQFFCGTDFYSDNKATIRWAGIMKIQMHLHSKKEWKKLFHNVGFDVKVKQIKDLKNAKKWKRELGTLFITGTKSEK